MSYARLRKNHEREVLLKRIRELDQEYAANELELWELKKQQAARLLFEEQFAFYLKEYLHSLK